MPGLFLLCHPCWLIVACYFFTFLFQSGTVTACAARAATIPPLLCHDAVSISQLLALLPLTDCCPPQKNNLRHHHLFDGMSCCNAANIEPWWLCYCNCTSTMLPCLWHASTVAIGWLLFFALFKSSHTITSNASRAAAMLPSLQHDAAVLSLLALTCWHCCHWFIFIAFRFFSHHS